MSETTEPNGFDKLSLDSNQLEEFLRVRGWKLEIQNGNHQNHTGIVSVLRMLGPDQYVPLEVVRDAPASTLFTCLSQNYSEMTMSESGQASHVTRQKLVCIGSNLGSHPKEEFEYFLQTLDNLDKSVTTREVGRRGLARRFLDLLR